MPAPPPPELRKLDYFAGTWLLVGEIDASPSTPAGRITEADRNEWMEGGYFLVVRSEFTTPQGSGTGVAYVGYDAAEKHYTYDEFNSMGDAIHSRGRLEDKTWTWAGKREVGGQITNTRWMVSVVSPASYHFKFEMSQDGTNWTTVIAGKATRQT